MKSNVDLTRNKEFHSKRITKQPGKSFRGMFINTFEMYKWKEGGVYKEWINYDNPATRSEFDEFIKGITIVATGSRDVRKHKKGVRKEQMGEICYECNRIIRIPWKCCPCIQKFLNFQKESCRKQLGYPNV